MMAKYIEQEVALNRLCNENCGHDYNGNCRNCYMSQFIENLPAADVAPVVCGRWDGTADGYYNGELVYDIWNCSECGFDADGADEKPEWKYCPNCGAKME